MSLFDNLETITCPFCGTSNPVEILYGMPSDEMFTAATAGLIELGGCTLTDNEPAYRCRNLDCGEKFGATPSPIF